MTMKMRSATVGSTIYAAGSGPVSVQHGKRLYQELLDDCLSSGCTGMLLDCRGLTGRLAPMGRYEFATFLADLHRERFGEGGVPPRIAIVAGAPLFDPKMFLETVAVNRGVELRAVTTLRDALAWLGVGPEVIPEWAAPEGLSADESGDEPLGARREGR
jgi:hypothetical protein